MIGKIIVVWCAALVGDLVLGHGENRPGPHQGYIKMPGAFHTELVPTGEQSFRIYLLDANLKNPTVKKSSVEVGMKSLNELVPVPCKAEGTFFSCQLPQGKTLEKGTTIAIKARHKGGPIGFANYTFPLKW